MATDRSAVLERFFPLLASQPYRVTSPSTRRYNCVAWANGVATRWWQAMPGYFWPDGVPHDGAVTSYMQLFSLCDFEPCDDRMLEDGVEKIAIYAVGDAFAHVARQLAVGRWTSKLGTLEDIEHDSLESLCGKDYGRVVAYMKRARGSPMTGQHP